MKLVILESPYHSPTREGVESNLRYARCCARDCLLRGESPLASHLLYTQEGILDDSLPSERALGIKAGLAWLPQANYSVYYTDHGWSPGMLSALSEWSLQRGYDFRIRALFGEPRLPPTMDKLESVLRPKMEK